MTSKIDFGASIKRSHTNSVKWDRYRGRDILPLWVADADFLVAEEITKALKVRSEHGIFGYTHAPQRLIELVVERMQRLYQWPIDASWIVWVPGVVASLNLASRCVGNSNSRVLIPSVIYPHFTEAPEVSDRLSQKIPMKQSNQRWIIDLEWLAQHQDKQSSVLLFCNPQNPGGSVYTRAELEQLAEQVVEKNLIIASDEIHCDLILEAGLQHIPIASLNEQIAKRSITLMAASKTFNIAGLGCSFAIIPDRQLRQKFIASSLGIVSYVNLFGYTATQAAFESGDNWHRQLIDYLRGNRDYLYEEINHIRGLKLDPIEATYLAWIDASELGLDNPHKFFEQGGVGLSPGEDFGDAQFVRLNFGCPRALLEQAVSRMREAVDQHWATS